MALKSRIQLNAPFGVAKQKPTRSVDRVDELIEKIKIDLGQATKLHLSAVLAIKEIHDEKLYLKYSDTFYEFCDQMLNVSKSLVYRKLHQLAVSEATGQETQNVHSVDQPSLIKNDLQSKTPSKNEIDGYNSAVFPGSQLPQPEPKKPTMKPDKTNDAPLQDLQSDTLPNPHRESSKDYYAAYTPKPILNEIAQWRSQIDRRISSNQDNPGFRKALTEWMNEGDL